PNARAADLSLGAQQQVEIVKALWRGSRVLILDEPTSMLTPQAFAELEKVLERLTEQGQAIVFITHKLHEAVSLGDRITILRQGRVAGTLDAAALAAAAHEELRAEIVRIMFGEGARAVADVAELREELVEHSRSALAAERDTALELKGVSVPAQ